MDCVLHRSYRTSNRDFFVGFCNPCLQAGSCLDHAACGEVPRFQLLLAGLVCQTTLLAQQTIHESSRCALLLMPANALNGKHSCEDESAAETALSTAHQGMVQQLAVMVPEQLVDVFMRVQQLEQIRCGGKWRSALRGCLVNVHMHYALVLAAQQPYMEQQLLVFAKAAHSQQPMLTHATLLVKEVALAKCFLVDRFCVLWHTQ